MAVDVRQLAEMIISLVQGPTPIEELVIKVAKAMPAVSESETKLVTMNLVEHGKLQADRHRRICPAGS